MAKKQKKPKPVKEIPMNLFQDLTALLATLKASPFSGKNAFLAFLKVLNDVAQFIGPVPMFTAKPGEDCCSLRDQCIAACDAINLPVAAEGDVVGKIGDGKILEFIIKFLPLILAFLGPKPPTA